MIRVFLRSFIALALTASAVEAQDSTLVIGTAVSALNGAPLPYSTVSIGTAPRKFTSANGSFSFRAAPASSYRVVVKQLGYVPLDTVLVIKPGPPVHLTFALRGIAYRLAAVRTETRHPCAADIRSTELSSILEQVRENAERDRLLRTTYPFQYRLERTRRLIASGAASRWSRDTASFVSTAVDPYIPGQAVRERPTPQGGTRELRIPQLVDLADSGFLASHCFSYGGRERVDGRVVHEIDFEPTREVTSADVRGAALLDTATFEIQRLEFQLTRGETLSPPVEGFRVTATYRDLAPGLRILDDVESVQDFARERPWDPGQKGLESQKLLNVRFLNGALDIVRGTPSAPLPKVAIADSSKIRQALRDSIEAVTARITEEDLGRVGFYERKSRYPRATFIGMAELKKRIAADSTDIVPELRWVTIGAWTRGGPDNGGLTVYTPICLPSVWAGGKLAEVPVITGVLSVGRSRLSFGKDLSLDRLAAVEVYPRGGPFPQGFRPDHGNCGSIVLWTKATVQTNN